MKLIILSGSRSENSNEFWRILWLFWESVGKLTGRVKHPTSEQRHWDGHTTVCSQDAIPRVLPFSRHWRNMPTTRVDSTEFHSVLPNECWTQISIGNVIHICYNILLISKKASAQACKMTITFPKTNHIGVANDRSSFPESPSLFDIFRWTGSKNGQDGYCSGRVSLNKYNLLIRVFLLLRFQIWQQKG